MDIESLKTFGSIQILIEGKYWGPSYAKATEGKTKLNGKIAACHSI